jgi:predicted enzyme related to lactoylglutathione lyase
MQRTLKTAPLISRYMYKATVMQIEHVAVYTKDLEALKSFYARYFGARVGKKYVNASKQFES